MPKGYKKDGTFTGKVFKKGQHPSPKTEFKKGSIPWNKNKTYSLRHSGQFKKGHPKPKNAYKFSKGKKHPNWKNGRYKNKCGYIYILQPSHPFCDKRGYVRENRLVVEKQIGRYLTPQEIVHHEGAKDDNRPQMLIAFISKGYHLCFHRRGYCNSKGIIFDGRHI